MAGQDQAARGLVSRYKPVVASKTFSLLEFAAFCMEKNEVCGGGSPRWCPYRTPELAREQYDRLVLEATRLFGEPKREIKHGLLWPGQLAVRVRGLACMIHVAAPMDGPAWGWGGDPDWDRCNASDDLKVLFATELE